ncbi:11498_t:CDS:2, partial [Gigaspora margarita]
ISNMLQPTMLYMLRVFQSQQTVLKVANIQVHTTQPKDRTTKIGQKYWEFPEGLNSLSIKSKVLCTDSELYIVLVEHFWFCNLHNTALR